ncbi:MAG: hypothetical protein ACK42I_10170, partial [Thermomicrobium sp.]
GQPAVPPSLVSLARHPLSRALTGTTRRELLLFTRAAPRRVHAPRLAGLTPCPGSLVNRSALLLLVAAFAPARQRPVTPNGGPATLSSWS